MKQILVTISLVLLLVSNCYATRVIELTKFQVENIQIFKVNVEVDSGEVDEEGQPIMVNERRWGLAVNYTLLNDAGNTLGENKIFLLDKTQRNKVKNFLKEFINEIKAEDGIVEIE